MSNDEVKKGVMTLKVNGETHEVLAYPSTTLLEVLRENLNLTGTKEGCGRGDCGACTVLLDGKPICSCLTLAVEVQHSDVLTVEGLKGENGELHPLQKAFIEHGAIQCGYCTPGMLLSAKALLDKNPHPTGEEIKFAMSGNLCRCTGYIKIIEAIQSLSRTY